MGGHSGKRVLISAYILSPIKIPVINTYIIVKREGRLDELRRRERAKRVRKVS